MKKEFLSNDKPFRSSSSVEHSRYQDCLRQGIDFSNFDNGEPNYDVLIGCFGRRALIEHSFMKFLDEVEEKARTSYVKDGFLEDEADGDDNRKKE